MSSRRCRRSRCTSSTLSDVAEPPDRRKENFDAGRASTKALVRLVPVSSCGAPAARGPGTGRQLGVRLGRERRQDQHGLGRPRVPPEAVVSEIGPVTAPSGTRAWTRVFCPRRTLHGHVVALAVAAVEGELVDAGELRAGGDEDGAAAQPLLGRAAPQARDLRRPSASPRTWCRRPTRPRPRPPAGAAAAAHRTSAHAARFAGRRTVSQTPTASLRLWPTGLADGLAPEERRYHRDDPADSPLAECFDILRTVPPFTGPTASGPAIRQAMNCAAVYPRSRRLTKPGCRYTCAPPPAWGGSFVMKTYVATPATRERNWLVVDATGKTLGRLATQIADALRGKRKPDYTPHIDVGDFVVVVNAEKVVGDRQEARGEALLPPLGLPGRPAQPHPRGDARRGGRRRSSASP